MKTSLRHALVLACVLSATAAQAQSTPEMQAAFRHFLSYTEAAIAGDVAGAEAHWRASDVAAAARLGIATLSSVPRVDSDSPLWTFIDAIADSSAAYRFGPATRLQVGPFAGHVSLVLKVEAPHGRARKQYLFESDGRGGWLLARRDRVLAEQGPGTRGRFVTVHERRPGASWTLPSFVVANLDSAVLAMADQLGLPPERLATLEQHKLDYVLAAPEVVEQLAGGLTVGVAMLPTDLVLTSHPLHAHELAHVLANVWLGQAPPATLPLLQEGLAVHLGGRWGRHPRVLDRVGRTSLAEGYVTLDDLLTHDSFHRQGADLAYAPAGVFVRFVREVHGADALRAAYLACSGTSDAVVGWTQAEVEQRLAAALGADWPTIIDRFAGWLVTADPPALQPAVIDWSTSEGSSRQHVDGLAIIVGTVGGSDSVSVHAESGEPAAALLFGGGGEPEPAGALFAEHFPGRPYLGQTHGLLLTPTEARLYDYQREVLLALHSEGFWPSQGAATPYVQQAGRTLGVALAPGLLPSRDAWLPVRLVP